MNSDNRQNDALKFSIESFLATVAGDIDPKTISVGYETGTEIPLSSSCVIQRRLNSGGMGTVYLATQVNLGRPVAMKRLNANLPSSLSESLQREASFAAKAAEVIGDATIVHVYGLEQDDDEEWWYLAEYVPSDRTLTDAARDLGVDGIRVGIEWVRQVAAAVQKMHKKVILHLDLKPQNILVEEREGKYLPRIIDFGLAQLSREAEIRIRAGTVGYRAPEQWQAQCAPTERSDIYALGALLHTLLVGFEPKGDLQDGGVLDSDLPASRRAQIRNPADIEAIVRTCLRHNPEERYDSAGDLAKDLERWLAGDPVSVRSASPFRKARASIRSRWAGLSRGKKFGVVGGVTASFLLCMAGLWWRGNQQALAQQRETIRVQKQALSLAAALTDPSDAHHPMDRRILDWADREGLTKDPAALRALELNIAEAFAKAHSLFALNVGLSVFYQDEAQHHHTEGFNAIAEDRHWVRTLTQSALVHPDTDPDVVVGRAILSFDTLVQDDALKYLFNNDYGAQATSAFGDADPRAVALESKVSPYDLVALHEVSRLLVAEDYHVATDAIEGNTVKPREFGNLVRAIVRGSIECRDASWDGGSLVDSEPDNGVLAAYAVQMCGLSNEQRWQWIGRMATATRWRDPYTEAYWFLLSSLEGGLASLQPNTPSQKDVASSRRAALYAENQFDASVHGWREDKLKHLIPDAALVAGRALMLSSHPWGLAIDNNETWFVALCTSIADQSLNPHRTICLNAAKNILHSDTAPAWLTSSAATVAIRLSPNAPLANAARQALVLDLQVEQRWTDQVLGDLLLNPNYIASFVSLASRGGWNAAVASRSSDWGPSMEKVDDPAPLRVCDVELAKQREKGEKAPWAQCALRVFPTLYMGYDDSYG